MSNMRLIITYNLKETNSATKYTMQGIQVQKWKYNNVKSDTLK